MTPPGPSATPALDEILSDARHDAGCSAEHGPEYRCRCLVKERMVTARAEITALRAKADAASSVVVPPLDVLKLEPKELRELVESIDRDWEYTDTDNVGARALLAQYRAIRTEWYTFQERLSALNAKADAAEAMRVATIEECAKVCDQAARDFFQSMRDNGHTVIGDMQREKAEAFQRAADMLRALAAQGVTKP